MRVLLGAAAICALAVLALPPAASALTAFDAGPMQSAPTPRMLAIEAALERAAPAGDPIDELVLDGLRSFYELRNFDLAWLSGRELTPQMRVLRSEMDDAASYGLDAAAYATPKFAAMYLDDARLLAEADIEFSRAVARFVTHVASGRVRPRDISSIITLDPQRPDVAAALASLASSSDAAAALARFEPTHPQYVALKQALAELRARTDNDLRVVIPEGELLRPDGNDFRVPLLRLRLGIELEVRAEPELYDAALVAAVEAFQAEGGLTVNGIVGPRTLFAMNGVSREDEVASIAANLGRWRWMPRDLGAFHVMVNIPEFVVRIVDDVVVHQTRVVVGSTSHRTPVFSHVMDHLVVNPYWNVPSSIVTNEMLPEIRQNPGAYFSRHGYQVLNSAGQVLNPWSVDWYSGTPRGIHVRQMPGDANALGRIKFMFPNQYSVYLHDTPSKSLFERDYRALSHGCVRVDNPLAFADAILPVAAPEWKSARLEELYGGRERRINLNTPIPVHLAYFTVWVGEEPEVHRFEDVYGYDGEIKALYGV